MEDIVKRIIIILLLTSAALAVGAADVTVLSISGNVEIKEPGGTWSVASVGQVVSIRSIISTGFGARARLSAGGMELNLQPLTRVSIDSLTQNGETASTAVSLRSGRVRATRPPVTRSTRRSIDFRVSTPVATAAVRGTDFFLSADKLQTVEGLVALSVGQAVILSPGGTWSWAPEGLRPMDPIDLVGVRWGVSPSAGSMPGDGSGSGGRTSTVKSGYARITLK